MKKLLMVGFVFGDRYQYYIPRYARSILLNDPDADVCIYVDKEIIEPLKPIIGKLREDPRVRIVENLKEKNEAYRRIEKHPAYQKAIRWLLLDDFFYDYEAVYIGDVDIFVCREEPSLYEQHMQHMKLLGTPYSNYRRHQIRVKNYDLLSKAKLIRRHGVRMAREMWSEKPIELDRLTGLHFVKTKEYFGHVGKVIPEMLRELEKNDELPVEVKRKYVETDECILYELVKRSGLPELPITPDGTIVDYRMYQCRSFRPHHGIHFGAFRSARLMQREHQMICSDVYRDYYAQLADELAHDELLAEWRKNLPEEIQTTLKNIEDFYAE